MDWFRSFHHNGSAPAQNPDPGQNHRHIYFNATGHILFSTHHDPTQPLPTPVVQTFSQVISLFSAMMKTLSTTKHPVTNTPYSLFNYHALSTLIDKTGYFVKTSDLALTIDAKNLHHTNHQKLFHQLLGQYIPHQELSFAPAMFNSLTNENLRMVEAGNRADFKSAYMVFICECIAGVPLISIQLFSLDSTQPIFNPKTQSNWLKRLFKKNHVYINKESYLYLMNKAI
ncbi:hypothetical protein BGP78_18030 [Pseudoalteromonas sp. MSK9-3]|uniref:hypothetical protein n=1 Tax=Pseudoalteromonas sp. MSK9-3 TaxID=1897633 RepID=UPI000E6B7690|nr:hypothetical protein [Pseudoalteromonas sp. MSK9-3]RJE73523.1 hypothetical protein BGP78_18030 [Pseudoalteromonas sp. MSK9-3]